MTLRRHACLALLSFAFAGPVLAQVPQGTATVATLSPPASQTGYSVTGRVVCADTQRPARFAQVTLVPAASGASDFDRGRTALARTDLDGHFTLDNVPPGDFYATAELTGYINDAPAIRQALSAGGDALAAIASVPRLQVTAAGASIQLSLQRGAVLAGTVQWDDGSPASGVQVAAQPVPTTGLQGTPATQAGVRPGRLDGSFGFVGPAGGGQTDDRGRFRLSGLPPGSYLVRATVQSPVPSLSGGDGRFPHLESLSVFAPNKLRRTEATVLTVAAGEERADLNLVLNLLGMHTVSGQVASSASPVRSGSVLLTDQIDNTLNRRGPINPDGTFTVPYVPPGAYTLRVNASSQAAGNVHDNTNADPVIRFQPLQESITVTDTDLTGLTLTVTTATASQ